MSRTLVGGVSYFSAEKQSVYSTAPAEWVKNEYFVHFQVSYSLYICTINISIIYTVNDCKYCYLIQIFLTLIIGLDSEVVLNMA